MGDPPSLGVLLISGEPARMHFAFVMATAAAALGRRVTLFATDAGCAALVAGWPEAEGAAHEARARARGVATIAELRTAARELDVRLIACESGLRMANIAEASLLPGTAVSGVADFLAGTAQGQIVTL